MSQLESFSCFDQFSFKYYQSIDLINDNYKYDLW